MLNEQTFTEEQRIDRLIRMPPLVVGLTTPLDLGTSQPDIQQVDPTGDSSQQGEAIAEPDTTQDHDGGNQGTAAL